MFETAEREDGNNSFLSITFVYDGAKLKIDNEVAEKLLVLVNQINLMGR